MKKILAITLAVLMLLALAVPAFAAEQEQVFTEGTDAEGSDVLPQEGDIKVTYGVAQSYIVTIPVDVGFAEDEQGAIEDIDRTLSVTDVKIKGNEQITVAIDSLYDYKLVDTNQKSVDVTYTVSPKSYTGDVVETTTGTAIVDEAVVLTVNRPVGNDGTDDATDGTVVLTFHTAGTSQQGNYVDVLTFTVDIVEDGVTAGGTITPLVP